MRTSFILRIYNYDRTSCLEDINTITISNITILSKPFKYGKVCLHKSNQKKYKYTINIKGKFINAGSHNYPILFFKGKYIDIEIKNFPRYPCFSQDNIIAKNHLNGYSYNNINNGFDIYLLYRKLEFIHYGN